MKNCPFFAMKRSLSIKYFMFNPALHTRSIRINPEDLKKVYRTINNEVKLFTILDQGIEVKPLF